jgi:hypothetical protein
MSVERGYPNIERFALPIFVLRVYPLSYRHIVGQARQGARLYVRDTTSH